MHTEFKPEDPEVLKEMGYDKRDLDVPLITKYVFWITLGCVICFGLSIPAYNYYTTEGGMMARMAGSGREPAPASKNHIPPPNPLLQDNVTTKIDIKQLRQHEDEVLGSYGWVDQGKGTVHVPIEKAMLDVVKKGVSTGASVSADSKGNTIPQNAIGPGTSQQP